MSKSKVQEAAIQKSLELTEQEAFRVLIFIAGMEAEKAINEQSEAEKQRNSASHRSAV